MKESQDRQDQCISKNISLKGLVGALDYRQRKNWPSLGKALEGRNRKQRAIEVDFKIEVGFILDKTTREKEMCSNKTGLRDDPGSYRRGQKN